MNILAALTPDQFTSTFDAWVAAGVAAIVTLTTAALYVVPKLAALKATIEALKTQHVDTAKDVDANTAAIVDIAKSLPPAAGTPANPVK